MKKSLIPIFIVGIFIYTFIQSFLPQNTSPTSDSHSPTEATAANSYALNGSQDNWPNLPEDASPIASNLLAANYYIVFDGSGSMAETRCSGNKSKLGAAKEAIQAFIQQLPADANVGLFVFDKSGISERVALLNNNRDSLISSVIRAHAGGGTPLRMAMDHGYRMLSLQAEKQLGYGEYNLVIVTDGEASSGYDPTSSINKIIKQSPVVIHTIGFCIGENHSLNQAGRTFYKAANDPESLRAGLESVLAEASTFNVDTFSSEDL